MHPRGLRCEITGELWDIILLGRRFHSIPYLTANPLYKRPPTLKSKGRQNIPYSNHRLSHKTRFATNLLRVHQTMEIKWCQNFYFWFFLSFKYLIFSRGVVCFCYALYTHSFYVNKPQVNIMWHYGNTWHSLIAHYFAMGHSTMLKWSTSAYKPPHLSFSIKKKMVVLEMLPLSKPPLWHTQCRQHLEMASLFPVYVSECSLTELCLVFCFVFWIINDGLRHES